MIFCCFKGEKCIYQAWWKKYILVSIKDNLSLLENFNNILQLKLYLHFVALTE